MILAPEKATKGLYGESREFPALSEKALQAPLTILQYHPESSPPPTFATPFDNNAEPPSYSDSFATSASSSPTSSTTEEVIPVIVPTAPGSPASSFTRVPSKDVMYPSFQPMFLVATGKTLDKGFPNAPPPSKLNPHPFVSHDINEGDWIGYAFC